MAAVAREVLASDPEVIVTQELMAIAMLALLMVQLQSFSRLALVFVTGPLGLIGATGALLIALIRNGSVLLDINTFYQQVIIGVIIWIAVFWDQYRRRRAASA